LTFFWSQIAGLACTSLISRWRSIVIAFLRPPAALHRRGERLPARRLRSVTVPAVPTEEAAARAPLPPTRGWACPLAVCCSTRRRLLGLSTRAAAESVPAVAAAAASASGSRTTTASAAVPSITALLHAAVALLLLREATATATLGTSSLLVVSRWRLLFFLLRLATRQVVAATDAEVEVVVVVTAAAVAVTAAAAAAAAALLAKPSRADERKRDESRAISSSARARVSSMHARWPAGKTRRNTRDETGAVDDDADADADVDAEGEDARWCSTILITLTTRTFAKTTIHLVSARAAEERKVQSRAELSEYKRTQRARTHTHAPAMCCYSRASRPQRGLRLRSTPALGSARLRSARLDPTRLATQRVSARLRAARTIRAVLYMKERTCVGHGAGGEERLDAERVNHHRLGEHAARRGGGTRDSSSSGQRTDCVVVWRNKYSKSTRSTGYLISMKFERNYFHESFNETWISRNSVGWYIHFNP